MNRALTTVFTLAILAQGAIAGPIPVLIDINKGDSPTATAADFTTAGVAGLAGTEAVDVFLSGAGQTVGGIAFTSSGTYGTHSLTDAQVATGAGLDEPHDLMRDYIHLNSGDTGPNNVSLGNLDLGVNNEYTLYLFGNLDSAFVQISVFTPIDGDNITFTSTDSGTGELVVNFVTGAGFEAGVDTVDFEWARVEGETYAAFNGFAIVEAGITPLSVDYNSDDLLDDKDLNILLSDFGAEGKTQEYLDLLLQNFVTDLSTGDASTVPEPSGLALLLLGVFGLTATARRRK